MKREEIKIEVAQTLLDIGAVFLRPDEPFTWASGIKSPVYCDNRLILSSPKHRTVVEKAIAQSSRNVRYLWEQARRALRTRR